MDRRTVLAFVLIGLILVLMPYYMRWVYGDKYDTIQVDPVEQFERVEPGTRTRASSVPVGEREKVSPEILTADKSALKFADSDAAPAFVPKEILVDTEHFQAVLSSRGGVITSWKLKSYFTKAGDWLELLPSGGYGLSVSVGLESLDLLEFVPSDTRLTLSGSEQADLILRAETAYGIVEKRVRFQGDRYHFQLMVSVAGLPREADIGVRWHGALADTEELGRPAGGFYEDNYEYVVTYAGGEVEIWDLARIQDDEEPPSGQITWTGIRNKYFLAAMIPAEGRYVLKLDAKSKTDSFGAELPSFDVALFSDNHESSLHIDMFVGPISYNELRKQNTTLDGHVRELDLDEFVDYGPSFIRSILKPVTILILKLFAAIHEVVPNYGVVIILFSLVVKIVVFPLTHKSLESAAKMQQLQPKIAELKEKYKDSQKMNQAMMKLYKDEKINPLGGCLPMVLQMPILFSLFSLFRGTIELRHAHFMLWITDLSQPDTLMIGGFALHLLPLLMGVSMFIQQKMTMKDPKQAALVYIMPVFLTYIFWTMSSGLVFYYTLYNVFTLAQQIIMERTKRLLGTT